MPKKEYSIPVYNSATGKYETVRLNKDQYNAFRRGEWNIEYRDEKFFKKEIQFSGLICGNGHGSDDEYSGDNDDAAMPENFREFITHDDDPQLVVERRITSEIIVDALLELDEKDLSLILSLLIFEKTEREYAKEIGEYQMKIHRRKETILKTLREKIGKKNFI